MGTTFVRRFENFDSQSFESYESSSSNSVDLPGSGIAIEEDKKQTLDSSLSLKSKNGKFQSNGRPNIHTNSLKEGKIVPFRII